MFELDGDLVVVAGRDIDTWEIHDSNGNLYAVFFNPIQCAASAKAISEHDNNVKEIARLKGLLSNKGSFIPGIW